MSERAVPLVPVSETEFYIDSRYRTRIAFDTTPDGRAKAATINPGRWAQQRTRLPD